MLMPLPTNWRLQWSVPWHTFRTWILGANRFISERTEGAGLLGDWVYAWIFLNILIHHVFFFIILECVFKWYFFSPSSTLQVFCGWGWKRRLFFINLIIRRRSTISEILSRGTPEACFHGKRWKLESPRKFLPILTGTDFVHFLSPIS